MNGLTLTPTEAGVIRAVNKHNCRGLFDANADRVRHFAERMKALGRTPAEVVIVLLNVNDPAGAALAEALMPGHNWQPYRDRGELPIARGLAGREGITEAVRQIDSEAGTKLAAFAGLAVVVVDHGTAEIFAAP